MSNMMDNESGSGGGSNDLSGKHADTVLQVNNVNSRMITTDNDVKEILAEKLRFRPKDYFHNAAYKAKKWDGWKYFFSAKTGLFLTGILPEVKAALKYLKKEYTLLDTRDEVKWRHETINDTFLNNWLPDGFDPIKLHDYQPDLVNQCIKYHRGIVTAPCGAGKTFILISALKCLPPKTPTLFLTKSASLVHQNYLEMQKWGVENLGRWYDKYKEPNYVMCATTHVKTLASLEKLLPKFRALIVDEVHDCMSDVPVSAYRKMKNASVRIGISATAYKWDKKKIYDVHKWGVKGHFGPMFKTTTTETGIVTTKDLQERAILSSSDCSVYKVDRPNLAYEPYGDAIKLGIEQNFHFHEMVSTLAKSCPGRTLVVVERVEQGKYLEQMIPGSTFIYGNVSLKDREPILTALKKGDKSVAIVMRHIITAGIDIKIHDLINAAGGDSAHNIIQLMGRGLRTADDKDKLRYHDFLFLINDYLRKHSEWRIQVLNDQGHTVTIKESVG
jgi:superfamily II DNA or RNA helicase